MYCDIYINGGLLDTCKCKCCIVWVIRQRLFAATTEGDTPLHTCAHYGQTECMKLLLRVQPDLVNAENDRGLTALEIAKAAHREVCVELVSLFLVCIRYTVLKQDYMKVLYCYWYSSAKSLGTGTGYCSTLNVIYLVLDTSIT